MKTHLLTALCSLAAIALFSGCGKKETGHQHAAHAHQAPHGGTLIEIGEHAYNLEVVHDAALGKLSVYILDGHAENFVRVTAPTLPLQVTLPGGAKHQLALAAIANAATGEKVGDTALFEGQADWLKSVREFDATVSTFAIKGTSIVNLSFNFPKGSPKD